MPVLGKRYPKPHINGEWRSIFASGQFNNTSGVFDSRFYFPSEEADLMVSPARYSEVRKVTFWCVFRQETVSGGTPSFNVRLRVAPRSLTDAARSPVHLALAPGNLVRTTAWPGVNTVDTPILYAQEGPARVMKRATVIGDRDYTIAFVEFDRFFDNDFFNDWDNTTARDDEDEYLGYKLVIERSNGTWTGGAEDVKPVVASTGMSVVQAPATQNNTVTYINVTHAEIDTVGIVASDQGTRGFPFFYREAEWDGIESVHVLSMLNGRNTAGAADYKTRLLHSVNNSQTRVERYNEDFTDITAGANQWVSRTADVFSTMVDGDNLGVQHQNLGVGSHAKPRAWLEIIQKNCNRTVTYHLCGHGQQVLHTDVSEPLPDGEPDQALFDPVWYQQLEDGTEILAERLAGGLRQTTSGGTSDGEMGAATDALLDSDFENSITRFAITPNVTPTPIATQGIKFLDAQISQNSPINLTGKQKIGVILSGGTFQGSTGERPGGLNVVYLLSLPNAEFSDLGPLFELGAFNPEGCAATSAGLGDPGMLVITNGSTIPKHFFPEAGFIEDNGVPRPFPDELPTFIVEDNSLSPGTGLFPGIYRYRYTLRNCCTDKESDPNPDDIVVDTSGASPGAKVTLSFANVRIPGDPQICEVCVYRTVLGGFFPVMRKVGCFDPDLTTLFEDTTPDDVLAPVPTAADPTPGSDVLLIVSAPMPCVPIVVDYRNRLFGMGDIPELSPAGTVSVTQDSDIVTGSDLVVWDRCLEGKFIQLAGDCRPYEIDRVLPPAAGLSPPIARLLLVDPYEEESQTGANYIICGRPNRIYFSEPLEPECWPLPNFLDVEPGDGDKIMGAVSNFDRLVICKRNKTYVMAFRVNPAFEILVPTRISSDIGCIGPRTFAQVESGSVWLADRGVAFYDGRTVQHVPESDRMNNIFTDPENPNYVRRDANGRVLEAVGVFYPKRQQYLLLLPTVATLRGSNIMLVWDVKMRNVTLLKFCQEFQSMVVAKDSDGNERVYLGDANGFVWIYDIGDNDGVGFPNQTGTVRGFITDAGLDGFGASFFEDTNASFITGGVLGLAGLSGVAGLSGALGGDEMGMAGACVAIRAADAALDDPWDIRFVYATTQTKVYVTPNWETSTPEVGFEYMIGAIDFRCIFKPKNYSSDDPQKRNWSQIVTHKIETVGSRLRTKLLIDFATEDTEEDAFTTAGEVGRHFLMSFNRGRQTAPTGRQIHNFHAVELLNFAPDEPISIYNHALRVEVKESK